MIISCLIDDNILNKVNIALAQFGVKFEDLKNVEYKNNTSLEDG